MSQLPLSIGCIHFIGIGGIGMSGVAEILHEMGYQVQGSDIAESANVVRLTEKKIPVSIGHDAGNITDASIVVISTAIKADNPEVAEARRRFLPVVHRAEMLGELMRLRFSVAIAGTHGKTTTTSLIATLLDAGGIDPTVINGGIITGWGSNARLGASDWMVVEADESDGSFSRLKPTVAIVTNIDPEHLDHHGDFENLKASFRNFVSSIPFYGFASLCIDHPEVQRMIADIPDRRLITYGFSASADIRAVNVKAHEGGMIFDVQISSRMDSDSHLIKRVNLPMLGEHNVLNCLAAISVALEMNVASDRIRSGLKQFRGVGRRFEVKGSAGGITVIDDYGHHPVEIRAALAAARMLKPDNKIIAVFQPHRYTRLRDLFGDFCGCFNDADHVLVADVYSAGEDAIEGADAGHLVAGLTAHGHQNPMVLEEPDKLAETVLNLAGDGDLVICLGAGSITHWAGALPDAIRVLVDDRRQA